MHCIRNVYQCILKIAICKKYIQNVGSPHLSFLSGTIDMDIICNKCAGCFDRKIRRLSLTILRTHEYSQNLLFGSVEISRLWLVV